MEENKQKLKELVDKLIALGEDKAELSIWLDTFDILDEIAQKSLLENLEKEAKDLS